MTPAEILAELHTPEPRLPSHAMVAAMDHPDAVIPGLLAILEGALADPDACLEEAENNALFCALYLLAQFREPRALPLVLDLLRLSEDVQDELLGDGITESMPSILASLCQDAPSTLEAAALDPLLDPIVRLVAMDALLVLGFQGRLPEARFQSALDTLLTTFEARGAQETAEVWGFLASTFATAGFPAFLPRLQAAFAAGLVGQELVDLEGLEAALARDPAHYRRRFLKSHHLVEDALLDLEDQPWLDPDAFLDEDRDLGDDVDPLPAMTPAIMESVIARQGPRASAADLPGRNAPCPCGSGKKYKRCCGMG